MRAIIQRVLSASVTIENKFYSGIDKGLLIFIGIEDTDRDEDIDWLAGKILRMRIFNDQNGIMNYSVLDVKGDVLVVSQFTLHASTKKGNRPSYSRASKAEFATDMYLKFVARMRSESGILVRTGEFAADMNVNLINTGPVTLFIDTKNKE